MRFELKGFGERNIVTAAVYETATRWMLMWRFGYFRCFTACVPKGTR